MPKVVEQHSISSPEVKKITIPDFSVPGISGNTFHPIYNKYFKGETRYADSVQNHVFSKAFPNLDVDEELGHQEDKYGDPDIPYHFDDLDEKGIQKAYPKHLLAHLQHIRNIISKPEYEALDHYISSSDEFNKYLRANKGHLYTSNPDIKNLIHPSSLLNIQHLHNLFNRIPMFKNYDRFNVYRGLKVTDKQLWDWVKRISQMKEKGHGFILPEMLSTSLSPITAHYFSHQDKSPALLEIVANHGIFTPENGEHEFILPNRSKFRLLETLPNKMEFPSGRRGNIIRLLQI